MVVARLDLPRSRHDAWSQYLMTELKVLISCPMLQDSIDQFSDTLGKHNIHYETVDVNQNLSETELLRIIDNYDGVIAGDDEFTRSVIEQAPRLKVISKWGVGTDAIDKNAAADEGVKVYNTPGEFANEVADVVIGYAIMLSRHLHKIDREVRDGTWFCPRGESICGKTLGIIGMGNIGSAVARRAYSFNLNILGNDIYPIPESLIQEFDLTACNKSKLLEESDFVSLNCELTPETNGMIGSEEIDLLGPDGYLINTARGALVDEDALVEALEQEGIGGAGLDVYRSEPLPEDHPLTKFPNVVLGSHNAQNTRQAVSRVNERSIKNLIEGLRQTGAL